MEAKEKDRCPQRREREEEKKNDEIQADYRNAKWMKGTSAHRHTHTWALLVVAGPHFLPWSIAGVILDSCAFTHPEAVLPTWIARLRARTPLVPRSPVSTSWKKKGVKEWIWTEEGSQIMTLLALFHQMMWQPLQKRSLFKSASSILL